jgi:hypothetical protein
MSDKANQGEVSFEGLHDRFEQSHRLVLIESAIAQMRRILDHGDLVSGNGRRLKRARHDQRRSIINKGFRPATDRHSHERSTPIGHLEELRTEVKNELVRIKP